MTKPDRERETLKPVFFNLKFYTMNLFEFFKEAKNTEIYDPNFEKKYYKLLERPHIVNALKSKDFQTFLKLVKFPK